MVHPGCLLFNVGVIGEEYKLKEKLGKALNVTALETLVNNSDETDEDILWTEGNGDDDSKYSNNLIFF